MALMKFREENQVNWIGARPGHNGTQILKIASAQDAAGNVHTVSAGKTLYLTHANLHITAIAAGTGNMGLYTDAVALLYYNAFFVIGAVTEGLFYGEQYWPPIELPAGYHVLINSDAAGLIVYGSIHGWEE